jgi:hypothetical protein
VLEALETMCTRHSASMFAPFDLDLGEESGTYHEILGSDKHGYGLVEIVRQLARRRQATSRVRSSGAGAALPRRLKQYEVAERVGVSQVQVSRIVRRANDQLRQSRAPSGLSAPTEPMRLRRCVPEGKLAPLLPAGAGSSRNAPP